MESLLRWKLGKSNTLGGGFVQSRDSNREIKRLDLSLSEEEEPPTNSADIKGAGRFPQRDYRL